MSSRDTTRASSGFIYAPLKEVFYPKWKVVITDQDDTQYTIADMNSGASASNHLINANVTIPATDKLPSAVVRFANPPDSSKQQVDFGFASRYDLDAGDTVSGGVEDQEGSNNGTAVGYTTYDGTVSGATWSAGRNGSGALDFDGADDYSEVNDNSVITSLSVSAKETQLQDICFKPDGTELYIVGSASDTVHQYTLGTAWSLDSASFTRTCNLTGLDSSPRAVHFSSDGLKMYVLCGTGQSIKYYTLGTAWNIGTATYVGAFSLAAVEATSSGLYFSSDGTKFYVLGYSEPDELHQYTMNPAWDMSTAAWEKTLDINANVDTGHGLWFDSTGTSMFIANDNSNVINEFALGTAWDIATATYTNRFCYLTYSMTTTPTGVFLSSDGLKMFVGDYVNSKVWEIQLNTANSLIDARYQNGFTLTAWIKPDSDGESDQGRVWDNSYSATSAQGILVYVTTSGRVAAIVNSGTTAVSATNAITYGSGVWYHVAVTCASDSTLTMYIDGVQSGTPATSGALSGVPIRVDNSRIGNRTANTDRSFDGEIMDVRMYNRALTAAEVLTVKNSIDGYSGDVGYGLVWKFLFNEGTGTTAYDTNYYVKGPNSSYPAAWNFQGAQYVAADNGITDYPFTIGAWFWVEPSAYHHSIISLNDSTTSSKYYMLYLTSSEILQLHARNTSANVASSPVLSTGWHRGIGVFRSATDRELFVDGESVDTDTPSVTYASTTNKCNMGLFRTVLPGDYSRTPICGTFVSPRIWTPDEIADDYNDGEGRAYPVMEWVDSPLGKFTNAFTGGETVDIYADYVDATTRIFRGKIDNPKHSISGNSGFTMEVDARSCPELTDQTVVGTAVATTADQLICAMLYDNGYSTTGGDPDVRLTFWSGSEWAEATFNPALRTAYWVGDASRFPTMTITTTWQNKKPWTIISETCEKVGLSCYLEYDDNRSVWFLRTMLVNDKKNDEISATFGDNIISISNFGPENTAIYNYVTVYGKQESDNIILLATEEDTTSQDTLWMKELVVTDSNLKNNAEVREKAEYLLSKNLLSGNSGTVNIVGEELVKPGEQIMVSVPHIAIAGYHTIQEVKHTIDASGYKTSLDVLKINERLYKIFREKTDIEKEAAPFENLNDMKDSFNIYFDENPSSIEIHSGTVESEGKLMLDTGQTLGIATSKEYLADYDVTQCELRKYSNFPVDENDTYEVSNDGGTTWETYDITSGFIHTFSSTGNQMRVRLTLRRASINDTSPAYESIVLLFK